MSRFSSYMNLSRMDCSGNLAEQFQQTGPKIVLVLDNASYHKQLDIREQIVKELPNVVLEFLPAYSPDFNLLNWSGILVRSILLIACSNQSMN